MKLGISGFEWIRRVLFFWLLIEEELLCKALSWNKCFIIKNVTFLFTTILLKEDYYYV